MKIGHHFGKRKPRWNFFTQQYQNLMDSPSQIVFKLILISVAMQLIFFLPVLYWVFQNYAIIQNLIPLNFNITENLEFEKKWIVFIILASTVAASLWNAFLWLHIYKQIQSKNYNFNDQTLSHDEAVDQRLAS